MRPAGPACKLIAVKAGVGVESGVARMTGTDDMPTDSDPVTETKTALATPVEQVRADLAPPPQQRSPLWLVLGGVVAAVIGYLLAQVVPFTASSARLATLQSSIAALTTRQDELDASLAGMSDAMASTTDPVPDAQMAARIDDLDNRVAAVQSGLEQMAALADRLAVVERQPAADGSVTTGAMAAMATEIATLRRAVDAAQGASGAAGRELAALLDQTRSDLKAASAQAQALKGQFDQSARRATGQAAMLQIDAALKTGAPFDGALDDLAAGGVVVPDDLRAMATGVPSMADLQAGFDEPARAALSLSLKSTVGDSAMQRLSAFVRNQVGARSLTARDGSDPDAILSRADAALAKGDLAEVVTELAALPAAGQAAMAGWVAMAQSRLDAEARIAALSDSLGQ